jgi:2,5-diketo-D-gluconate reductase A
MTAQPMITLNDGNVIPQLGLGVFRTPPDETAVAVRTALEAGYRHIDTAKIYGNEAGVGEAVRNSGLARSDVFVTTKVWNTDQGYDAALAAADRSLGELGFDYIDLYLLHWPAPKQDLYVDTWRALIRLKEEGRVRSIGVSNFTAEHLDRIVAETGVVPTVNQIEIHPLFQQDALRAAVAQRGIAIQAWSPLGRGAPSNTIDGRMQGKGLFVNPAVGAIAEKHGKTPAQVVIRWHLDDGRIVIPKSVHAERQRENFDVFDFTLDADDRAAIATLDDPAGRIGSDPMTASF